MKWTGDFINNKTYPDLTTDIGKHSYGKPRILMNSGDKRALKIGSYCSIGENVKFFCGNFGIHPTHLPSTFPLSQLFECSKPYHDRSHLKKNLDINVGSDVWLGRDVTVFAGVTIGHGAIVGTGSIVTKDVKPYEIVAGMPAKHIRFRYDDEIIKRLLRLRWWDFSDEVIKKNIDCFYDKNIEAFLNTFEVETKYCS